MAAEKGVDLKDRVRGEARGVLGNGKMSSQNTLSTINALLLGQSPKKAAKPPAWEGDGEEQSAEQALFKTFVPTWAQAELARNARRQSIGAKRPRLEFESPEVEIPEEQPSKPPPPRAISATASLSILATTWQSDQKFHVFLWKLPTDKFELNVEVTDSGNSIEISFKRLLPSDESLLKIAKDVLGLPANKITEVGNFANSYKAMPSEGQIRVLSTDHMTVANVDDISCLTFPFFDVDKKDGKKKII